MAIFKSSASNKVVRIKVLPIRFGDANNIVILDSDCTRASELDELTAKFETIKNRLHQATTDQASNDTGKKP